MTDIEEQRKKLNESIEYFDNYINTMLQYSVDGVKPMDVMKHYNVLRNELAKLYVD